MFGINNVDFLSHQIIHFSNRMPSKIQSKTHSKTPSRKVFCQDALQWLVKNKEITCIITSVPEMDELKLDIKEYESFFRNAAKLIFEAITDDGYAIFLQTDRKHHGWIDKGFWITDEAMKLGFHTVWKKIALTRDVGKADLFRPTYSNMLCFTRKGKVGKVLPDVITAGEKTYTHAFGIEAVTLCVQYAKDQGIKTIVDPFCGSGTTLAVANQMGLDAIGVEIDKKYCEMSRKLVL
jgi:hypothetical protein